jgi:hypothetical protein
MSMAGKRLVISAIESEDFPTILKNDHYFNVRRRATAPAAGPAGNRRE